MKIALVGSSGGHLSHLMALKPFWEKHDRWWVTFDKPDANSLLVNEEKYNCYFPTNRNVFNLIRNTFLSIKLLYKKRPDVIISSGAAVSIPFFYIGKLLGCKLVYIEVYDRVDKPTISGRIVSKITDLFVVQWKEQLEVYPEAVYLGSIF